jgi:hypothetical protein
MKKILTLFAVMLVVLTASAQTLNITVGNVTYQYPASQTGDMTFSGGNTVTIMGKAFKLNDVSSIIVDNTEVTDGTVGVVYEGTSAKVFVAGNIAQYITPAIRGAHVSIDQSSSLEEEVTYTLSGSSSDGEFYATGYYKATVELNGLTLTNSSPVYSGAAVCIQNGKRIKVKVVTGTTNTLADAANGSQKGCLYIKGHAEFAQKGTLNVKGNVKHAIKTGEYFSIKNATINVTSSVGDGISCNEYFLMESGTINISGVEDDGIQCEIDGESSTGETTDHEDEDSGNIYITGGSINVACTAASVDGIKSDGDITISDGTINVSSTGNKGEGIECENYVKISGGQVTINSYDDAINAGQDITISGGYVFARSTNNDGIDANGDCYIKGGVVYAIGGVEPEVAIDANSENHKKLYIQGGSVIAVGGIERGASISGGTCKSTTSWTADTWHALYSGSNLVLAFQTPSKSSGRGGNQQLVVYTSSTPSLQSGVSVSGGTAYFGGMANVDGTVSGGSSVNLNNW